MQQNANEVNKPRPKPMRRVLAVLSDEHAGSGVGLLNPDVRLYEEDEFGVPVQRVVRPSAVQAYLWDLHERNRARTLEIAGRDEIVVIHNGDITQGMRHPEGLFSTRVSDQVEIAVANLSVWLAMPTVSTLFLVAGTQVHELGEASAPRLIQKHLQAAYPRKSIRLWYHGLIDMGGGVLVDVAHHGPNVGSREWLKGNVARFYLRDLLLRERLDGNQPPHLVFRGHYHSYVRETLHEHNHTADLIVTPAYAFMTDYARQKTQSQYKVSNGHVVCEIEGGCVVRIHKLVETIDIRTREVV